MASITDDIRAWLLARPALCAAATYGVLVYFILPPEIIVINDDFGYLRSVLETLRHGRPWTGEWLEPWSASLAMISALLFKVTGSAHAATSGLQALLAAATLGGAYKLVRERGLTNRASLLLAALAVTLPTQLFKSLEYTAMTLYLPGLLWAIWAAEKRRWGWFFLAWFLAFSSRQSAIAWLVLPLGALVRSWLERPSPPTGRPGWASLIVLAGAAAATAVLWFGMNQTHSQAIAAEHAWDRLTAGKSWQSLVFGVGTFLISAGIGAFVLGWRPGRPATPGPTPWRILGVLAAAGAWLVVWNLQPLDLYVEHAGYRGLVGKSYVMLLAVVALTGWLIGGFVPRAEMMLAGLVSLALVCLRADVWDYYYIDVAWFGFVTPWVRPGAAMGEPAAPWPKTARVAVCTLFISFHLLFVCQLKLASDRAYAVVRLAEQSLRAGRIDVTELSFAPFGFIGWHLHPHYLAHEGGTNGDIGGFTRYLRQNAVVVRSSPVRFWRDSRSLEPGRAGAGEPLASEVFSIGWFWHQRVSLWRNPPHEIQPAALPLDAAAYRSVPFPLNRDEWRRAAQTPGT